jgi:hypothetical protein
MTKVIKSEKNPRNKKMVKNESNKLIFNKFVFKNN